MSEMLDLSDYPRPSVRICDSDGKVVKSWPLEAKEQEDIIKAVLAGKKNERKGRAVWESAYCYNCIHWKEHPYVGDMFCKYYEFHPSISLCDRHEWTSPTLWQPKEK